MTVKELIAELEKLDQDAPIYVYHGYWCDDGDYELVEGVDKITEDYYAERGEYRIK